MSSLNIFNSWKNLKQFYFQKALNNKEQTISSNYSTFVSNKISDANRYTEQSIQNYNSINSTYVSNNYVQLNKDYSTSGIFIKKSTINMNEFVQDGYIDSPAILFKDNNNITVGKFGIYNTSNLNTGGAFHYYMHIPSNVCNNNKDVGIRLMLNSDGSTCVRCNSEPDHLSDNDQIATTKFVKKTINNILDQQNNCKYTGIYRKVQQKINIYSPLSSNIGGSFVIVNDINNNRLGALASTQFSDGSRAINIICASSDLANNTQLSLRIFNSGYRKIYASHNPLVSSNDTQLATTNWVRSSAGAFVTAKSFNGFFGYTEYSSGLLIQGGRIALSSKATLTCSLLKSYPSTNYIVLTTCTSTADNHCRVTGRDKTKFTFYADVANTSQYAFWMAIGNTIS